MKKHKHGKEVREGISDYVAQGIIENHIVANILRAKTNDEMISALTSMYDMTVEMQKEIWFHLIEKYWDVNNEELMFDIKECAFMKELIRNKGFLDRSKCKKIKALGTDYKIGDAAEALCARGIIDIHVLNDRKVLYLLSLTLFKEVFNDGN